MFWELLNLNVNMKNNELHSAFSVFEFLGAEGLQPGLISELQRGQPNGPH